MVTQSWDGLKGKQDYAEQTKELKETGTQSQ